MSSPRSPRSSSLTGYHAGENERVKPHGLSAVLQVGFMYRYAQLFLNYVLEIYGQGARNSVVLSIRYIYRVSREASSKSVISGVSSR